MTLTAEREILRFGAAWLCVLFLLRSGLATAQEASAADPGEPEQAGAGETESTVDTPEIDVEGSIGNDAGRPRWSISGDLRLSYSYTDQVFRDGSESNGGELIGRIRLGGDWSFNRYLRGGARVAGICSTEGCDANLYLDSSLPISSGIDRGDITFDELFLHLFRRQRFDVAVGRLQTKFVSQGGVFAKSLDRNDSNNVNVNWTDGIHATVRLPRGWTSHLILQANRNRGSGNVRREPLDFQDDDSHVSYFVSFEKTKPWRHLVQRAFDISYLPDSLLKDGTQDGRIEDYWGVVGRLAARWPQDGGGLAFLMAGELGYAPETPAGKAVDLDQAGDVKGLAWNLVASVMNIRPGHSLGLNYGRIEAGWLLSPQFQENEELIEVRYLWRKSKRLTLEARVRRREDLDRPNTAVQDRDAFDGYVRLTWLFQLGESARSAPAGSKR